MSDKSERLLFCMNDISDRAVEEAAETGQKRNRALHWKRWVALAAVLVLAVGGGSQLLPRMGGSTGGNGAGQPGADGATAFMSYAGPVFPLTLKEENSAVTAVRDITLDFDPWIKVWWSNEEEAASRDDLTEAERQEVLEQYHEWYPEGGRYLSSTDILVTDSYVLTNRSEEEQTVTLLYPFVSSLRELEENRPTLMADGRTLEAALRAGGYSGGFMGAVGGDLVTEESAGSLNLDQFNSWEEYKTLLSDGSYLERALGDYPDLTGVPAIVYEFTDPWGPERDESKGIPNPTIRADFNLDYDKTTVLSYGFDGLSQDVERGWMDRQFSIPQPGYSDYGRARYLIILGEDIRNLTTQGYNTGGWDTTTTVEAGVTVRRYETDLDSALRKVTDLQFRDWQRNGEHPGLNRVLDYETYHGLFCAYLTSCGALAENGAERYDDGMLESLDVGSVDRVCYLEARIAIPARGSVALSATMAKKGSYDYDCAHTENRNVYGYDLVTELGSNLVCTAQTATLKDRGQIEIQRQNFGFDLENGVRTVTLNPDMEHYYLEVKRLNEGGG